MSLALRAPREGCNNVAVSSVIENERDTVGTRQNVSKDELERLRCLDFISYPQSSAVPLGIKSHTSQCNILNSYHTSHCHIYSGHMDFKRHTKVDQIDDTKSSIRYRSHCDTSNQSCDKLSVGDLGTCQS